MFRLTEFSIPDYYGFYSGNYISLNTTHRVTTTTPSELFSYQVADGYAHSRDKQFELTIVFLTDESFANGMDTLLWLTDSGKEGKLSGVIEGNPSRNFYMYCTCVGVTSIDFDKNGAHKIRASFYAREPFWIEEESVSWTSDKTATRYFDVRTPTRMNIWFRGLDMDLHYVHLLWQNVEHGDWQHSVFYQSVSGASSGGVSVWVDNHSKKIVTALGSSLDIEKASFAGYTSGEWFPTLLPANRAGFQGSYRFKFMNNNDSRTETSGTVSTTAVAEITFLKLRGIPF